MITSINEWRKHNEILNKVSENAEEFGQENDVPESCILTDGRTLYHYEQPFGDMGGETNYFIKYLVSQSAEDNNIENAVETTYQEIEGLLTPEDKLAFEEYQKDLSSGNDANSRAFVENAGNGPNLEVGKYYKCYDMDNNGKIVYSSLRLDSSDESGFHLTATNRPEGSNKIDIPHNFNYSYTQISNPLQNKM